MHTLYKSDKMMHGKADLVAQSKCSGKEKKENDTFLQLHGTALNLLYVSPEKNMKMREQELNERR